MLVRRLDKNDVDDIADIEKTCFGSDAWNQNMLLGEFDGGSVFFGCESDNRVVGYICARIIFDEADINNIAVLPAFRGQGYAKALISALKQYCAGQGADKFTLEVNTNNIAAKNLYGKMGFVSTGIRKGYYHGEDAEIMWLTEGGDVQNNKSGRT